MCQRLGGLEGLEGLGGSAAKPRSNLCQTSQTSAKPPKLPKPAKPPLIGLVDVCSPEGKPIPAGYFAAFRDQGAEPRVLEWTDDPAAIEGLVADLDLLMLCGGEDIDPKYFHAQPSPKLGTVNAKRDEFEWRLLDAAMRRDRRLPVFGICRGIQVINVYFGGTLWQDLPSEFPVHEVLHRRSDANDVPVHGLRPEPGGFLAELFGIDEMRVNSTHHQAVKDVAPGFVIAARSTDGVIEAIGNEALHIHGVQFHPERLFDRFAPWRRLFKFVVDDAKGGRRCN